MSFLVLGAGMVGALVARDLARDGHEVVVVDRSEKVLAHLAREGLEVHAADVRDGAALAPLLERAGLVEVAVP